MPNVFYGNNTNSFREKDLRDTGNKRRLSDTFSENVLTEVFALNSEPYHLFKLLNRKGFTEKLLYIIILIGSFNVCRI